MLSQSADVIGATSRVGPGLLEREVSLRAYDLWQRRMSMGGTASWGSTPEDDWIEAEKKRAREIVDARGVY